MSRWKSDMTQNNYVQKANFLHECNQLDKGWLHHALDITIPNNIWLLFQPAYSHQVNPSERFSQKLKKQLRWQIFENLDELRKNLSNTVNSRFIKYSTSSL